MIGFVWLWMLTWTCGRMLQTNEPTRSVKCANPLEQLNGSEKLNVYSLELYTDILKLFLNATSLRSLFHRYYPKSVLRLRLLLSEFNPRSSGLSDPAETMTTIVQVESRSYNVIADGIGEYNACITYGFSYLYL